ncbi:hypothetical protein [Salinicola sp. CPA57]|uniref:hypothetical protein n=1 Tax=Salinicola sp. CPA57 TaxID=1949080 RepID=UPI000DA190AE|nr:hypothetical protein [Salinicola sp. CPA57]
MNDYTDQLKVAAKFLRDEFSKDGDKVGSSHAHQVIAAYCGYNSKKALIDDGFDVENEELAEEYDPDLDRMEAVISSMKPTPLQQSSTDYVAAVIHAGLAPPCESCGNKVVGIQPLLEPGRCQFVDGYVCETCAEQEAEAYATCRFCGPDVVYRAENINFRGECPEHDGESVLDEEEEEDYESYTEYHTKDG